jgi:hypothetical protein
MACCLDEIFDASGVRRRRDVMHVAPRHPSLRMRSKRRWMEGLEGLYLRQRIKGRGGIFDPDCQRIEMGLEMRGVFSG